MDEIKNICNSLFSKIYLCYIYKIFVDLKYISYQKKCIDLEYNLFHYIQNNIMQIYYLNNIYDND